MTGRTVADVSDDEIRSTVLGVEIEHIAPAQCQLRLLVAAVAGNGSEPASSFIEVRPLEPVGEQVFMPVRQLDRVVSTVERLRERHQTVTIGAAPRVRRSGRADSVERVWALRADVDTPDAAARMRAFRPLPSIVTPSRTPGHLHAWWPLTSAISPEWARRACLRIASALGSDRAVADPARVMRAPSSFVRLELDTYTLAEVVRGLPDERRWVPERRPRDRRPTGSPDRVLAGLVRIVRDAAEGERNRCLNWSAYRAGQHVADGELDPDVAHEELSAAALDVGLSEVEVDVTIRSGLRAGGGV
jgi:hypothetical protein